MKRRMVRVEKPFGLADVVRRKVLCLNSIAMAYELWSIALLGRLARRDHLPTHSTAQHRAAQLWLRLCPLAIHIAGHD